MKSFDIKKNTIRHLLNLFGWTTKRKLIIFESDDWGSIRMSSKINRDKLSKLGFNINLNDFNWLDALEGNDDLSNLLEVLSNHKDKTNRCPVFTAVSLVGNPDFEKIRESKFNDYYWESISKTLSKYPKHDKVIELYKEGINNRLFVPVFHGREHLNAQRWLRKLNENNKSVQTMFDYRVTGFSHGMNHEFLGSFQAAFDLDTPGDLPFMKNVIVEGIEEFENLWGFNPKYFVPTNGPFNKSLEAVLKEKGVEYLLAERRQKEPLGDDKYNNNIHYLGMKNRLGQTYLTRNSFFEPSLKNQGFHISPIERCLKDISTAFLYGKPATICTHRINYVGFIEEKNRTENLKLLNDLLKRIIARWPEVEFITSVELGEIINGK